MSTESILSSPTGYDTHAGKGTEASRPADMLEPYRSIET